MLYQLFIPAVILGLVKSSSSMSILTSFHGLEHRDRINRLSELSTACHNCVVSGNHWQLYKNLTARCEPEEQIAIGLPDIFIFSYHGHSCIELYEYYAPLDEQSDTVLKQMQHSLKARKTFIGIFLVLICIGLLVGGYAQTPLVVRSNPGRFMVLHDAHYKEINGEAGINNEQLQKLMSEETIELANVCIHNVPKGLHV